MSNETEKKVVDLGVIVAAFAEANVDRVKTLAAGNDKAMVQGIDRLGSAMIIKGAEMMMQAGAPPEFVIQRVAQVVKEFRTQELKDELQTAQTKLIISS